MRRVCRLHHSWVENTDLTSRYQEFCEKLDGVVKYSDHLITLWVGSVVRDDIQSAPCGEETL